MSNPVKVKRSSGTTAPPQLSNGELAFTEAGNVMFIGNFAGNANIPIAGARVPGTLTANQAIVTNSTNMVDQIMLGNSIANVVANSTMMVIANSTANAVLIPSKLTIQTNTTTNSQLSATSLYLANTTVNTQIAVPTGTQYAGDYFLHANGNWIIPTASASAGGSNTYVQYNDSTVIGGSAGFTFDKDTNNVVIANTLTVGNSTINVATNSTSIKISNSTVNTQIVVPTAAEYAGSYFLHANGTWQLAGGGAPGGANTNIQFNDSAVANGTAGFTFDKTTNNVVIANTLTVGGLVSNSTLTQEAALNVTNQINTATLYVTTSANVGTALTANSTVINAIALNVVNQTNTDTIYITTSANLATNLVANTLGLYHTGTVNAASHSVGATFTANATLINAAAVNITGQTNTATIYVSTTANVGANVQLTTSTLLIGNSTSNSSINSSAISFPGNTTTQATVLLTDAGLTVGNSTQTQTPLSVNLANSTGNVVISAGLNAIKFQTNATANCTINTMGTFCSGNNTTNPTINIGGAGFFYGNSTQTATGATLCVANTTGNCTINTTSIVLQNTTVSSTITPALMTLVNTVATMSITILDPVNTDSVTMFWAPGALTIAEFKAVVRGSTPSVTASIYSATDRTATTTTHINANVFANATTGNLIAGASMTSTAIAANSFVYINITAVSGTVNEFHGTLRFTA